MDEARTHLESVGRVVAALRDLGYEPVLVGGMALVVLGSRRVTRDFDFVVAGPGARLPLLLDVFYDRGLELASRVNATGDVIATIDNRRVAAARLRMDAPSSAYFQNPRTGLRIDLLFDFPLPAAALAGRATSARIGSIVLQIASEADLLQLKMLARAAAPHPETPRTSRFSRRAARSRSRRSGIPAAQHDHRAGPRPEASKDEFDAELLYGEQALGAPRQLPGGVRVQF